jgi:hypothetical protein
LKISGVVASGDWAEVELGHTKKRRMPARVTMARKKIIGSSCKKAVMVWQPNYEAA